jgi:hypothetical protein
MLKITIVFLTLLVSSLSVGQIKKEVIYITSDSKILTENQFRSLDRNKLRISRFENDTIIINEIMFRKIVCRLDSNEHEQINLFLTSTIGSEFDRNKNTIIHVYRDNNDDILKDLKNKIYWKWLKKKSKEYQSFLIGTKMFAVKTFKKRRTYIDKYDFLENLFFRNSISEINHLYIKPNGEVHIYFGEKNLMYVVDHISK